MADIRVRNLEVRLVRSQAEIEAAQALRYKVFYEEMHAAPSPEMAATRRDFDRFDEICDHLVVVDHDRGDGPAGIVGTYRLLRRSVADQCGGFYSAREYDISRLVAQEGEILEFGRSCVDADYRSGSTMQLLWRGNAAYVLHFDVTVMFGCASFPGADPKLHALPLSYLYHYHLAPAPLRMRAREDQYVSMDLMPKEAIDVKAAMREVPPLIKGYLRLGGYVGDGAVIDPQWDSVDVGIVVKTDHITQRYRDRLTAELATSEAAA
ncbi:MAG: GNAT family N-acetyltransferase [Alphaproteobacteria bacterium]